MNENCVFCSIVKGDIPSFKIYEDELVLAFLDINPFSRAHALVVPKKHSAGLLDTDDDTLAAVVARVKKIAARIRETVKCDGFNILQNNGAAAGQTVGHLHFHIVPRYGSGPVEFVSGSSDMQELAKLAEEIRFVG